LEKKNHKTFAIGGDAAGESAIVFKSFLALFFEKETFLSQSAPPKCARRDVARALTMLSAATGQPPGVPDESRHRHLPRHQP
jgi:hypothetical protein